MCISDWSSDVCSSDLIRHDAAHPFTVDAGDCEVRVLGTRFSVRRDGDRTRVVVVDGRVEVRNGSTGVVLGADQRIDSTAHALSAIAASDPNIELAWRHRRLIVQPPPLAEVATELGPRPEERRLGKE